MKTERSAQVLFVVAAGIISLAATMPAGVEPPQYVDLSKVVNADTDYIHIWPPVVFGNVERNGYKFHVIDLASNNGKNVLSVSGKKAVAVPVPSMKGAYVYILHHTMGDQKGAPLNYEHAVYTVRYADGSSVDIPMRDGRETHQWWTKHCVWVKVKSDGATTAWPFFYGKSYHSAKYGYKNGVWATQWKNAHPDKTITGISFKPVGSSTSIIYAITITDADYFDNPKKNEYVHTKKNPWPPRPKDYFAAEIEEERKQSYVGMLKAGLVKGVRSLDYIAPDLLAITLDAVISQGGGLDKKRAAEFQQPERFTITSPDDADLAGGIQPAKVGRLSLQDDTISATLKVEGVGGVRILWHTYYLKLAEPLKDNSEYTVAVKGLEKDFVSRAKLKYNLRKTVTPAIKVNQGAYALVSKRRYAYLGWWAADLGRVDYSAFKTFQVIDEADGKVALEGKITLRKANDEISGEDVYEMDLAPLARAGRYHIFIPGLGRSFSFGLGGKHSWHNYYIAMRGLLHQRCGVKLTKEISDWPRRACHVKNYENGHLIYGRHASYKNGKPVLANVARRLDEPIQSHYGGYHDAGDSDLHYAHLIGTANVLTLYELNPRFFKDNTLRVPEGANGIPDILDEAAWGLRFYADTQEPDGGVFAGRINDQDDRHIWRADWAQIFGCDLPPYGNIPPSSASSSSFAAVAAQYSRAIRTHDAKKADQFLEKAIKAYEWSKKHTSTKYEIEGFRYSMIPWKRARAWAAVELFLTTGEDVYHQDFLNLYKDPETYKYQWGKYNTARPFYAWPYASTKRQGLDAEVREKTRKLILEYADLLLNRLDRYPYRMSTIYVRGSYRQLGGGTYGTPLLRAYRLTGEQKYLDAASLNADYQLGANPLSRSYITGLGTRPPLHHSTGNPDNYNAAGLPTPGSPVPGPSHTPAHLGPHYPEAVPIWRSWIDDRVQSRYGEWIIYDKARAAFLYGTFSLLENK